MGSRSRGIHRRDQWCGGDSPALGTELSLGALGAIDHNLADVGEEKAPELASVRLPTALGASEGGERSLGLSARHGRASARAGRRDGAG
jgi:hypothetical protein